MQPFPHPHDCSDKIWLRLAHWLRRYLSLKMFTDGRTDARTDARVGKSIFQPVNSSGKCRNFTAWQILQKSLNWQILAFMNKSKLKTCEIINLLLKVTLESIIIQQSNVQDAPFYDLTLLDVHLGTFKNTDQDALHYYCLFSSPTSFYISFPIPQP